MSVKYTPATTPFSQAGMGDKRGEWIKFAPALPSGLSAAGNSLTGRSARPGTARFTPSISGFEGRSKEKKNEFTLDWWTDTAIYNYNALLVSAFYGIERDNFREFYRIPRKDFLFIADSGGYQISTQGIPIDPVRIYKWMENNADVGMTLDEPMPITQIQEHKRDFNLYKKLAEKSRQNYEKMHKVWDENKIELLKVIQGVNMKEMQYWWDVVKDLDFTGAVVSPKPPTATGISVGLAFLMSKEVDIAHVFLGSGPATVPLLIYAKKFFKRLTFDSSSFATQGAIFRRYVMPHNMGEISLAKDYTGNDMSHLPCQCPVCRMATFDDMRIEAGYHATLRATVPGGLISLHNLWVFLDYLNSLHALSDNYDLYISFLKRRGYNDVVRAIDYLEEVNNKGLGDAEKSRITGNNMWSRKR